LLEEIDPEMTWKSFVLDDHSYQFQFQYPKWLWSKMNNAKGALVKTLMIYFDTPQEKRHGDAWFVKTMKNEMRSLKLSAYDLSAVMTTIYWG
jgi:hypothetical protein